MVEKSTPHSRNDLREWDHPEQSHQRPIFHWIHQIHKHNLPRQQHHMSNQMY